MNINLQDTQPGGLLTSGDLDEAQRRRAQYNDARFPSLDSPWTARLFALSLGLVIAAALFFGLSGCTSRTDFGDCIGIGDDKDPALIYKVSVWNLFLAVVGVELIMPPIFVAANETFCPVGKK